MPKLLNFPRFYKPLKQYRFSDTGCRDNSGKKSQVSFAAIPATMPYQRHPMTQITPRLIAALKTH